MIRTFIALPALTIAILQSTSAFADDKRQELSPLALQHHCDGCHAVREVGVGPPFLAVASRYSPEREIAVERLAHKIINGGAGNWGSIPMVRNERISLEDARKIARWVLSLADTR